jgi:hypothetical protein
MKQALTIIIATAALLCGSITIFAQDKEATTKKIEATLKRIEEATREREPEWHVDQAFANEAGIGISWKRGDVSVSATIAWLSDDSPKFEEDYVVGIRKMSEGQATIDKLLGIGDEGYLAREIGVGIVFRRAKVHVMMSATSEGAAIGFARLIDDQLLAT